MGKRLYAKVPSRKTNAAEVFQNLKEDIFSMRLLPGTKLSEADLAEKFGVSRQPVREALIRLDYLKLVRIRAQKATTVRKISRAEITHSQFSRLAIELEMAQRASKLYDGQLDSEFKSNLRSQAECLKKTDSELFNTLDYEFHRIVSKAAQAEFAFRSISSAKALLDRLCVLALKDKNDMKQIYDDHRKITKALMLRDLPALVTILRAHLARIDNTLSEIQRTHADFFTD